MNVGRRVVVLVTPKFSEHAEALCRFHERAAYGNTREEAWTKLRHMFASSGPSRGRHTCRLA